MAKSVFLDLRFAAVVCDELVLRPFAEAALELLVPFFALAVGSAEASVSTVSKDATGAGVASSSAGASPSDAVALLSKDGVTLVSVSVDASIISSWLT